MYNKYPVIVAPRLLAFLSADFANAMALFPFIIVKNNDIKNNKRIMHHECIHLRQQLELLIIPFYIWYGIEYLFRRWQFKNHYAAYRHISFEREAYSNEKDMDYLKKRKIWQFRKYI